MKSAILSKSDRENLIDELVYLSGRELSAVQIMFLEAVADKIGLNITDMRCLNFIHRSDKTISAKDLVRITGLTTGAITGVIDRLEKSGFIRRGGDSADRRLVIITPVPEKRAEVEMLFNSINRRRHRMVSSMNDRELTIAKDFMEKNMAVLKEEIDNLRDESI
jgi:DNA-binding MarR family transcriptional regulator